MRLKRLSVGHLVYSYFFARMAKIALEKQASGDKFYIAKLATVLRLAALSTLVPAAAVLPLLHSSAAAWVCAFGLYLWRFVPWLIRPRADARGGTPVSVALSRASKTRH